MATKYVYTMRFDADKIADIIEATIGRRPDGQGTAGWRGRTFIFDDTDITAQDRTDVLEALPNCLRYLFSFTRTVVEEE